MIGKINISDNPSFAHICAYVAKEEKEGEVLAAHGVRDTSAEEMAHDFDVQAADNPRMTRAVMHVALAWPPEEKAMSNELMLELTLAWMKEMNIDPENTQWSLTRHSDKKHPHGHLLINRVDNDGVTISDQKNFDKSVAACRKLEKQYGLVNAKEAGQTTRRASPEKLSNRDAAKLYVQDSESRHKPLAATPGEMLTAMKADGIKVQTKLQGGKLQSVVYEYQGHHFKGSELGRECSGGHVAKAIDEQRDSLLAQRTAVSAAVQQVGQVGAGMGAFFAGFGAQAKAVEKADRDALAQKQAQKEADEEARRTEQEQKQADEKAAQRALEQKQADEKAARRAAVEKIAARPGLDPRLRDSLLGIKPSTPTIQKNSDREM